MKMNCIVVCFDTLRHDAVFTDLASTPNLDRLVDRSIVFDNAWGEGEPTIPFRRAAMTGRRSFPWRYHIGDRGSTPNLLGWHAIPEDQTTLAEYLFQRGYLTGLITDVWHMFKPTMNFHRGFVSWDLIRGQEADVQVVTSEAGLDPEIPVPYQMQVLNRTKEEQYFVAQVFQRASEWVKANVDNGPFFLWVDSFSPHELWDPPKEYADAYYSAPHVRDYLAPFQLNDRNPSTDEIERTKALYQGYVTFCDRWFGHFLDTLIESRLLENTLLIVLSDHGTELWDKGRFGKTESRLHPYNTKMNWIMHHPTYSTGAGTTRINAFVQNHDLVPTILDALDIPHAPLDGHSLWQLVNNPEMHVRDYVITGWNEYACVRDNEWALSMNTVRPDNDLRLYSLRDDPEESKNVADRYPDVVATFRTRLEALVGGPMPVQYVHRPARGLGATYGQLRAIRRELGMQ